MSTINLRVPEEQGGSMLCLQPLLMVSKTRHVDMIHEKHILKGMLGGGGKTASRDLANKQNRS